MTKSSEIIEGDFEFISFEPITKGLKPSFENDEFVLFDKPSGLLIHPQNRHTPYSLVDEIKYQYGKDANITHRIDQETSGLVLAARNKISERDLKMMFQERHIQKTYLAFVHGEFKESLHVNAPLLRKKDESAIVRMVVKVDLEGKNSETYIKPLKYFPEYNITLVEAKPKTGRQHQIRVHLFHVKHPIVGDPIYGQNENNIIRFLDREIDKDERKLLSGASRLLLHAQELEFNYKNKAYKISSKTNFIDEALECFM
ncbi:MAG: RluA family pseudouridine synthase [Campylobacterota bacterium]|nr:RluA family pseudouridine synthase [Campylobacterota bacterium]